MVPVCDWSFLFVRSEKPKSIYSLSLTETSQVIPESTQTPLNRLLKNDMYIIVWKYLEIRWNSIRRTIFSTKSANCTVLNVWCTPNTVFYKTTGEINKHKWGYGGDENQNNRKMLHPYSKSVIQGMNMYEWNI